MCKENEFFFDYFDQRLKFIREACLLRIEGLVLMSCCLDALSVYCYGGKSRFAKFKNFILEFSNLPSIWEKISLPLLKEHFEVTNKKKLAEFIRKMGVEESSYFHKDYDVDMSLD